MPHFEHLEDSDWEAVKPHFVISKLAWADEKIGLFVCFIVFM